MEGSTPHGDQDPGAQQGFHGSYDATEAYQFLVAAGVGDIRRPKLVDDALLDSPLVWTRKDSEDRPNVWRDNYAQRRSDSPDSSSDA